MAVLAAAGASQVKLETAAGSATNGVSAATTITTGDDHNENEEAVFARAVNVKKTFCNLCNKKMATRKSLNTHYKSVHMKNAHTCSVCRTSFLFSRLLDEHTSRRKQIIPCEFCDLQFCSNKRWDSHIAKHRADSVATPAGRTYPMYPRAVPLTLSAAGGRQQQQSQPLTTAMSFSQRQSLLKKNNNSATPSPPPALIKLNNSSLLTNQTQQRKVTLVNLTDSGNSIGKFPCDSCGKIFLSLHYLQSHLVKRSNSNFQFQCDICEHRFSKKAILDEHKEYHAKQAARKVVPKMVIRQVNGTATTVNNNNNNTNKQDGDGGAEEEMDFDKHIIRLSDSSFKCNCCHRTFKAINHLKCHLRYTHMKKNFKCRSCNQQFPFYKQYLAHMKNSKMCERCDKRICAKVRDLYIFKQSWRYA